MATFQYSAINRTGQSVQGRIDSDSQEAAIGLLADQGRFVRDIQLISAEPSQDVQASTPVKRTGHHKISRRIKLSDKERCEFIRQMATALEAQLPILSVLNVVGEQNPSPQIKTLTEELTDIVRSGQSLSHGFSQYPRTFDRLHISLVTVGENSGQLAESMTQLAELSERDYEMRSDILTASMYPAFVMLLGIISVVVVVTWILPRILNALVADVSTLPLPTRVILALGDFFKSGAGMVFVAGVVVLLVLLSQWKRTESGRYVFDRMKLSTPLLKGVMSKWAVARFARTLGTLTASGVNILESLQIVRNCMGNEVLAREMDRVYQKVRTGSSLAEPLRGSGRFPPLLIQIVAVGEQTGELSGMLLNAADAYDRETSVAVKRFMAIFPGVLTTVLALIIGFIVAATLLPIVQVQTAIPGVG